MEYLGLFIELLFFFFALYLYLFSRGFLKARGEATQSRAEAFRQENGWWIRIVSLLLMAILMVTLYLHVQQLINA